MLGRLTAKGASSGWIRCWPGCSRATTRRSTHGWRRTVTSRSPTRTSPTATRRAWDARRSPSLLMKAVLLQVRDDVSDREAARRAAKDLDWKRALALRRTRCRSTTARLMVNNADERVLRSTVERAVQAGLFPKKVMAIVDSTGVMGAAAVADTFTLLRQAITRLGDAAGDRIVQAAPAQHQPPVPQQGPHRLGRCRGAPGAAGRAGRAGPRPAGRHRRPPRTWPRPGTCWSASWTRMSTRSPPTAVAPPSATGAPDRVVSVVDPEMRHGRKSASKRVDG